jgi:hypothetical protein
MSLSQLTKDVTCAKSSLSFCGIRPYLAKRILNLNFYSSLEKHRFRLSPVAHAWNPSYSGEDGSVSKTPISISKSA